MGEASAVTAAAKAAVAASAGEVGLLLLSLTCCVGFHYSRFGLDLLTLV
jgi:hypothetical protein